MFTIFNNKLVTKDSVTSIYNIKVNKLDGEPLDLNQFKDKYLLFVNVASECGFTGQYQGLEKLYNTYKDKLMVIGVPCNQFGAQEPGTSLEIQQFCEKNYGVSFLLTEKIDVKGPKQHPLYKWLTSKTFNGTKNSSVKWNFQKYLINNKGQFVAMFHSITKPLSKKITTYLK